MVSKSQIRYLTGNEINKSKWDECIEMAPNGLIYGYSFYLDEMAKHWDALVLNDYEAVMPLTWSKKYGFQYLYQPLLCAQLGVFGTNTGQELVSAFLSAIPTKFRYWDISLNHKNLFHIPGFQIYERENYVLNLQRTYDDIYNDYRENIKRNIRKSQQYGCQVKKNIPADEVIRLAEKQMTSIGHDAEGLIRAQSIYQLLQAKNQAISYGVVSGTGELLASCIFFFSHHRAYYILVGNHPNGRTLGASHALIDAFIRDHAEQGLLLDFEGSDLRNLAFFYSSFGAVKESYAAIRQNRLPWWARILKK